MYFWSVILAADASSITLCLLFWLPEWKTCPKPKITTNRWRKVAVKTIWTWLIRAESMRDNKPRLRNNTISCFCFILPVYQLSYSANQTFRKSGNNECWKNSSVNVDATICWLKNWTQQQRSSNETGNWKQKVMSKVLVTKDSPRYPNKTVAVSKQTNQIRAKIRVFNESHSRLSF